MRFRHGPVVAAVLLPVLALVLACGADEGTVADRVVLDLVSDLGAGDREGPEPEVDPGASRLHLPFGATAAYFLRLPDKAILRMDRLDLRGSGSSRLRVSLRRAYGAETEVASLPRGKKPVQLALPGYDGAIVRLTLEAVPGSSGETGGFTLEQPRVSAPVGAAAPEATDPGPEPERPNLIVYLVDTLRADHLGAYGYAEALTPNFDRLAEQATLFEHVVAQSSWTRASVASIVTGLGPHLHRVQDRTDALSEDALTLAEMLSAAGYTTVGVVTNGNVGKKFGFDQGFDHFLRTKRGRYRSSHVNEQVFRLLDDGVLEEPFLLWVHTLDPHHPYEPPEEFRRGQARRPEVLELGSAESLKSFRRGDRQIDEATREQVISLYDSEVTSNDHYFGRLVERLESLDLWDDSLVVLVSDHGEEFWEHDNWGHGHTLYDEQLAIPLVIKEPGQREPRRIESLVQLTDLLPTLLDWAGIAAPESLPGRSLRGIPRSSDLAAERPVYSHLDLDQRTAAALTDPEWKLIVPRSQALGRRPLIFRRDDDPSEARAVSEPDPVVAGYLLRLLDATEAEASAGALEVVEATLDDELVEELRALGYLQ